MPDYADRMKELRENKGITQKELADALNVTQTAVTYWETRKREPSIEMIRKIAEYFEVAPSYLMGWETLLPISFNPDGTINHSSINAKELFDEDAYIWLSQIETIEELKKNAKSVFSSDRLNLNTDNMSDSSKIIFKDMLDYWLKLNTSGQQEAKKQLELLAKIPEYRKNEPET